MKRFRVKIIVALLGFSIGIAGAWVAGVFSYLAFLLEPVVLQDIPQTNEVSVIPNALDWDLTYTSVLEKNNVARGELIRKWLDDHPQSPARNWISEWRGEPIVSAILLEIPAPHAA